MKKKNQTDIDELEKVINLYFPTEDRILLYADCVLDLISEIRKLREANGVMLNAMSEVIVIGTDYERRKYMGSQVMEILTHATNEAAKIMGEK